MNRWHIIFLTILLVGGSWIWQSRLSPAEVAAARSLQPAINFQAPDFTLTTLDGDEISLAELRGKPVVLNFWATWCNPCQREMPALQATAEEYADDVVVLGIDQGESAAIVRPFIEEYGISYPIPLDTKFEVASLYNVRGLPTTFFIDRDGVIRHFWLGEMNRITLAEGIAKVD